MSYAGPFTRKVLRKKDPDLIRALQEASLDRSLARKAGEVMIDAVCGETPPILAKLVFRSSLDVVFDNAQSPLETQFFTSLLIHSLVRHYMGFHVEVCPPASGCRKEVEDYAKYALPVAEQYFRWKATNGEPGEFKKHLICSGIPESQAEEVEALAEFEFDFGLYYRPRIMLQPRFPEIRVEGRSVQADALVYIPANPTPGVIIECDGWKYHQDKQSFRRDRARDRAFTDAGYIVRRYAGAEIHESVFDASYDLIEYLYLTFDITNASSRKWIDEFKKSRGIT